MPGFEYLLFFFIFNQKLVFLLNLKFSFRCKSEFDDKYSSYCDPVHVIINLFGPHSKYLDNNHKSQQLDIPHAWDLWVGKYPGQTVPEGHLIQSRTL